MSREESTLSRSLGFIPAAADVLSLASRPPTPRQLREAEAARERSRLDEALALLQSHIERSQEFSQGLTLRRLAEMRTG